MKAIIAAATVALAAAGSLAAQTSLTIYNDGRVLVRRTVPVNVPKGTSSPRLSLGTIEPSTLFSLDSGVIVHRAIYDGAIDEGSALRRSVGKRIVFHLPKTLDTVSALVLGVDPLRLQMPDGRIAFSMPGTPSYAADAVVVDPATALTIESARATDRLRLGYFSAEQASWEASYNITIGKQAAVTGAAILSSPSLRFEDVEIQLLAGAVGRVERPDFKAADMAGNRRELAVAAMVPRPAMPGEERVGEFHLYSLPERASLLPGIVSTIALFKPAQVTYAKRYVVRSVTPYWGIQPSEEGDVPVEVRYVLQRQRKTDFGDRPLPEGVARIYQADSAGRPQLIGEAAVRHTAAGHELDLTAGNAFDLTARRVQSNYTQSGKIQVADYQVTLRNETDSAVTIDVLEERPGQWTVTTSSVPATKISSSVTRFRVTVPARGTTVLTYQVRVTTS